MRGLFGRFFMWRYRRWLRQRADIDGPSIQGRDVAFTNALDYYGFWKLFDGLCDAAFRGANREYALGNTPEQRFMGRWSDGTPVKQLAVGDQHQ